MSQNLNEVAAMALVGEFISVKELLTSAMKGFAEDESVKSQENADLCFKALQTFLNSIRGLPKKVVGGSVHSKAPLRQIFRNEFSKLKEKIIFLKKT